MRLHPILLPAALASLAGCAVGPDAKAPKAELPARWEGAAAAEAPPAPDAWWTLFGDPELSSLVGRAAGANLDVRQAVLRVGEARAERDLATPARWPSLSASAGAERQRISEKTAPASLLASEASGRAAGVGGTAGPTPGFPDPFNQAQYGFDATWEIDLFGRVRRSVEAADAQARATEEESRAALVTLAGEVARTYVDLRGTQARRAIALQAIGTLGARLELAREVRASGYGTDADVAQAGALEAAARAQVPDLDREVALDINRLSLLLALEPGALRGELAGERPIPPVPPAVPAGIPSDLLRRRPDIRAAEERLHSATARVGVATADLYPRLTLTAGAGYQAERGADLGDWAARYASIGPALELPIFDSGRRHANIRLEDARARTAAVAYAQAVLNAVHEVENALAACREGRLRQAALSEAAAADRDALGLARQRYAAGLTAYGDVLAAERASQEAELALAQGTAALSTDVVMLCKALGGCWSQPPSP
jgi:NodT family efflux transporter outer membrane factor (OMF) lipoprotein